MANDDERAVNLESMYDFRLRSTMKKSLALGIEFYEARDQAKAEVESLIEWADLPSPPTQTLLFLRAKAWLAEARGERREDPERCLFAAVLAASFASSLKPEEHPEGELANLRTETWTEVANARRLTGDFESAEAAFHRAAATATEIGPLLESAEAAAQFLLASRRLTEADDLLAYLQGIRERRGEQHAAGRICLERGIIAQLRQDEIAALHLFLRGLQILNLADDPNLALAAFHNTIDCTSRLGHFETALAWLERCKPLYEEYGDEIDLLRCRWVEAQIQAGLGNLPCADAYLRCVREEFEDHNLFYQASLVTLDLCAIWIRRGKFREVACGVDDAVSTFQSLKVRREALAGLLLLQEAARGEQATVAMVQAAGAALRAESTRSQ
ncbi:MAG TPA: hypothetical protein VGS22_12105 [Thermoanaerobaculia bacterium]|nr:hypothetical protein [Thermoanaerobaculia bacterium]